MEKLTDISYVKSVLQKHGFTFSKSLGQNFLINPSVCPRMAEMCGASQECGVIEIGPGAGVLTAELAQLAYKVVAVELDKRLLPVLDETLKSYNNIKVINNDAMKLDFHKLIADEFQNKDVVVCANLPYYITSPVIMRLLEEKLPIQSLTVMVQKEAADRICAEPGTRASGAISVAVRYYAEPQVLFRVSAGSFLPTPKVDSAVIKLNILSQSKVNVQDEKFFFRLVHAAFAQRRKTVLNSINSGLNINKPKLQEILSEANISSSARAEELNMEQFSLLSNLLIDSMDKN